MRKIWTTKGFEEFREGHFGNAGQNIYVSRAGVLQRIHQFDLTGNGYPDLLFCNSQSHWEQPPSFVYHDPLGACERTELPSRGAFSAAVLDLNGDGFDDLVLGFWRDGLRYDLNAVVYFGSKQGLTEQYHLELPAPGCTSVAAGDFMGNRKPAIAFLIDGHVRLFYQTNLGFEIKSYIDLNIYGQQLFTEDLDHDGFADLIVRSKNGDISIFWGSKEGIVTENVSHLPKPMEASSMQEKEKYGDVTGEEYVGDATPLPKTVKLGENYYILISLKHSAMLMPVYKDRSFGRPLVFDVSSCFSVAAGDITGNGFSDLVFACRDMHDDEEYSWIYWGSSDGYNESKRTPIRTQQACDVAVGDLNCNGFQDVVICQNRTKLSFTTNNLVFPGCGEGVSTTPLSLVSHDSRRVFIAHTSSEELPQLIIISNFARSASDEIDNVMYPGSSHGFSAKEAVRLPGWGSYSAIYADLNDDGLPDLSISNGCEFTPASGVGSYIFYGTREGIPQKPDSIVPTVRATTLLCADLNRDGYLDIVSTGFNNPYILIFYGSADGYNAENSEQIRLENEGNIITYPMSICLADLNNDGWLDLIVADMHGPRGYIFWGGPAGFSMKRSKALAVWKGRSITAADLSGNGYLDLLIGAHLPQECGPHDSFLTIYWNGPEGISEERKIMLPVKSANSMAVADFNNDGRLDIFTGAYGDSRERDIESYIYWNRKGRGFSYWDRQCLKTHAVAGCMACDFNEDGWIDLAVANHKVQGDHKGYSEVWWNGPKGFNSERTTKLPTIGARGPSLVQPGNIRDRGPEEYYVSAVKRLPDGAKVVGIEWQAEIPQKTWVKAQLRSASEESRLDNAEWYGPNGAGSWFNNGDPVPKKIQLESWLQYRLALGAINSCRTPRITEVSVLYIE